MAVPDFQSFFKPLLDLAADGKEHSVLEACGWIAKQMHISEEDIREMLPSKVQSKFHNRIAWAKSYFLQSKVFEATRRAHFIITDRGRDLHKRGLSRIDIKVLNEFPEFLEFHKGKSNIPSPGQPEETVVDTPEEALQKAYESIRNDLAGRLLKMVSDNTPAFFERLVVDLMVGMGYGGSREDAGKSVGGSGDEGIDGIIKEDRLGLDVVYLQAKRWTTTTVGRPEVQKFVGALQGKRAKKGVFITTGKFSEEARSYVHSIDPKVVLIDGRTLADLMIDFNIGTTTAVSFHVKKIDSDYFEEE